MKRAVGLPCFLALVVSAHGADAAALAFGEASISLTYAGISSGAAEDATVIGRATNLGLDANYEPGGFAIASDDSLPTGDPTEIGIGDELRADVTASSYAIGPLGVSSALVYSEVLFAATNVANFDLELTFRLDFDLLSKVQLGDSTREVAVAYSDVSAEYEAGPLIFQAGTAADSDFGPLFDGLTEAVLPDNFFTLSLAPNESRTIVLSAIADVAAVSLATVPLPVSAPLLAAALGLLAAGGAARREAA